MRTRQEYIDYCKAYVQNLLNSKNLLVSYIRNDQNLPVGAVVAVKTEVGPLVGWAVCHPNRDTYNKYCGIKLAVDRALGEKDYPSSTSFEEEIDQEVNLMWDRASRYFKYPDTFKKTPVRRYDPQLETKFSTYGV